VGEFLKEGSFQGNFVVRVDEKERYKYQRLHRKKIRYEDRRGAPQRVLRLTAIGAKRFFSRETKENIHVWIDTVRKKGYLI